MCHQNNVKLRFGPVAILAPALVTSKQLSALLVELGDFASCHFASMAPHLTNAERMQDQKVMMSQGGKPMDALRAVNASRQKKGLPEINKSAIYRFCKGETHRLGCAETRGRKRKLTKADAYNLDRTRRRLIKAASRPASAVARMLPQPEAPD